MLATNYMCWGPLHIPYFISRNIGSTSLSLSQSASYAYGNFSYIIQLLFCLFCATLSFLTSVPYCVAIMASEAISVCTQHLGVRLSALDAVCIYMHTTLTQPHPLPQTKVSSYTGH